MIRIYELNEGRRIREISKEQLSFLRSTLQEEERTEYYIDRQTVLYLREEVYGCCFKAFISGEISRTVLRSVREELGIDEGRARQIENLVRSGEVADDPEKVRLVVENLDGILDLISTLQRLVDEKWEANLAYEIFEERKPFLIRGRVLDEGGRPMPGVRVSAFDRDVLADDFLGYAFTDEEGRFEIRYSESDFKSLPLERKPDLKLTFERWNGEEFERLGELRFKGEPDEEEDLGEIRLGPSA